MVSNLGIRWSKHFLRERRLQGAGSRQRRRDWCSTDRDLERDGCSPSFANGSRIRFSAGDDGNCGRSAATEAILNPFCPGKKAYLGEPDDLRALGLTVWSMLPMVFETTSNQVATYRLQQQKLSGPRPSRSSSWSRSALSRLRPQPPAAGSKPAAHQSLPRLWYDHATTRARADYLGTPGIGVSGRGRGSPRRSPARAAHPRPRWEVLRLAAAEDARCHRGGPPGGPGATRPGGRRPWRPCTARTGRVGRPVGRRRSGRSCTGRTPASRGRTAPKGLASCSRSPRASSSGPAPSRRPAGGSPS